MTDPDVLTGLDAETRGAGALRVQVNGKSFGAIPLVAARELGLRVGMVVDESLRLRLCEAADAQAAYRFILAALGRRGFARRDLERRLVHRGHPASAARAAIERAAAAGLLDDRVFAQAYAEAKSGRGRGPARLLRDLFSMGVDRAVAEEAVAAAWQKADSVVAASRALAEKRAAQLGALPLPVKRRRLLAYLARRGFTGREVRQIVQALAS